MKIRWLTPFVVVLLIGLTPVSVISQSLETTENLDVINIEPAWQITTGDEDVVIAVIDSGIDTKTALDRDIMWQNTAEIEGVEGVDDDENGYIDDFRGWDFVDQDNSPQSDVYGNSIQEHGTIVASIIASPHTSEPYGIAPNVKIMDLRALDVIGSGSFLNIFDAVEYAYQNGADVISMSIGSGLSYPGEATEVRDANEAGVPVIVAAGNNPDMISEIANDLGTIAVSSVGNTKQLSSFSSYGNAVDFAAPGEAVPSTLPTGETTYSHGTSMATPHVAGVMGLMLSVRDDLPREYLYEVLAATAEDLGAEGKDPEYGQGLIDAGAAVMAWSNFENMDFDNDGVNAADELAQGRNPFISEITETVNEGLPIPFVTIIFSLSTFVLIVRDRRSITKFLS